MSQRKIEVIIPIGSYRRSLKITPPCGLAGDIQFIGDLDNPAAFYRAERIRAGLIWFLSGSLEYGVRNPLPRRASIISLQLTMELCSEAPEYNHHWPSDITLWLNNQEIGVWTSPGDFGGERGQFTPSWWDSKDTQYGILTRWVVNEAGSFVNDTPIAATTVHELVLDDEPEILLRFGVQPDGRHVGGMNLFGRSFGNYPQDIVLSLEYVRE